MADLRLKQYISDNWFQVHKKNLNQYIDHYGQEVRLLKRSQTEFNQYSDVIRSIHTATTEVAVLTKSPLEANFMGPPLIYTEDTDSISQYFAYFKTTSLVRIGDIVVVETKSLENDVVLDAYIVGTIKGRKTEQEYIRRYLLTPFRDASSSQYEDDSILDTDVIVDEVEDADVNTDSGGFSDDFYETEEIVNAPGTEGFVTPDPGPVMTNFDPYDVYSTEFPDGWIEGRPYDISKPIVNRNTEE